MTDVPVIRSDLTISGASGWLTVEWTPTTVTDGSAWSFDDINEYEIRDFPTGWGISTLNDTTLGSGQFQSGEASLLTFNTSNLALDSGKVRA